MVTVRTRSVATRRARTGSHLSGRWRRLPLGWKGVLAVAAPMLILLLVSVPTAVSSRSSSARAATVLRTDLSTRRVIRDLQASTDHAHAEMTNYAMTASSQSLTEYQNEEVNARALVAHLSAHLGRHESERLAVDVNHTFGLLDELGGYSYVKPYATAPPPGLLGGVEASIDRLRDDLDIRWATETHHINTALMHSDAAVSGGFALIIAVLVLIGAAGTTAGVLIFVKGINRRVRHLTAAVRSRAPAAGSPPPPPGDELDILSDQFRTASTLLGEREDALRASERRYRSIVETAQEGVWMIDASGITTFVNPRMAAILGYEIGELLGRSPLDFMDEAAAELFTRIVQELADGNPSSGEGALRRKGGEERWVLVSANSITGDDDEVLGYVAMITDITLRHEALEALRRNEEALAEAQRLAHVGNWDVDVETGEGSWSDENYRLLGYEPGQVEPRPKAFLAALDPIARATVSEGMAHMLADPTPTETTVSLVSETGERRWLHLISQPTLDDHGRLVSIHGTSQDVTDRKRFEDTLSHQALHDDLTGLPNRSLVLDRLRQAIARVDRHQSTVAVMVADLDRFKVVNDSLGHAAGDLVLVEAATRLQSAVRASDTVARLGGDEFIVLCEDLDTDDEALRVADRILAAMSRPMLLNSREIVPSASVGIAFLHPGEPGEASDLLRDADAAMYRAKAQGPGRAEVFDSGLREQVVRRLELEPELRAAIDHGELRLFYQPQVSLQTGAVVGVEALVRWQHPDRGLLGPYEFIPLAEETGLIVPLGEWVLREACREVARWHSDIPAAEHIGLSVNLSGRQLDQPGVADAVRRALRESGLHPEALTLEITETVLMNDPVGAEVALRALRLLGIGLSIDDFGTGYSSLAYLQRFPVDSLKVDRSFVQDIQDNPGNRTIAASVAGLARGMQLSTVAEGVETAAELNEVRAIGCDVGQGFYWSRPLPPREFEAWLAQHRQAPVPDSDTPHGASAPRARVLVADDAREHRVLIRRILERSGRFEVVAEAEDGQRAVDLARTHSPDLVVLDVAMPVLDGLTALPLILQDSPNAKVVLISGCVPQDDLDKGRAATAAGFLDKGISAIDLVTALTKVVDK